MELKLPNTQTPPLSFADFLVFLLCYGLIQWVLRFQNLYLVLSSCQFLIDCLLTELKIQGKGKRKNQSSDIDARICEVTETEKICYYSEKADVELTRRDVEMVMEKLGMSCDQEAGDKMLGKEQMYVLFEENEPSLREVKEAFNVFDDNRDGFIDARELQRVLCNLGFKEGLNLESCERMIRVFDTKGDDRIDFTEFVKFMENGFC